MDVRVVVRGETEKSERGEEEEWRTRNRGREREMKTGDRVFK